MKSNSYYLVVIVLISLFGNLRTINIDVLCTECFQDILNGTGTLLTKSLVNRWIFDYSFLQPNIELLYQTADHEIEEEDFVQNPSLNFYVSEHEGTEATDLVKFPFTVLAIVPVYNLPELNEDRLVLSRENLGLIFLGNISYWNDPRILSDNIDPDVIANLPSVPIQIALPSQPNEATEVFTGALNTFSLEWNNLNLGNFSSWPSNLLNNLNYTLWNSSAQTAAALATTPYTISYTVIEIVNCYGLSHVALINKAGTPVTATADSLAEAQESLTTENFWNASLIDTDGNGSWPISTFSWAYLDPDRQDCSAGRELLKFWAWHLQSTKSRKIAEAAGYAPLKTDFAEMVIDQLEKLQCNDSQQILSYEMQQQHLGKSYTAVLGLAMGIMCLWWIISAANFGFHEVKNAIPIVYSALVVIGTTLGFLSVIFWFLIPKHDWICQARMWLAALGLTITCAAMFSRTLQVLTIYSTVVKGNRIKFNVFTWFHTYGAASIITLIQIILMTVFQLIDPWQTHLSVTDTLNYDAKYECSASTTWLILETIFFGICFLFGIYVVYKTWEWEGSGTESKLLLVAIYTVLLVSTALGITAYRVSEEDRIFFYVSCGIILILVSITSVVSVPFCVKMFVKWFKEKSSSWRSKTGSGSGKTSGARFSSNFSQGMSGEVELP